mmetsp:Transcript_11813/g.38813  ORF Transcript_11813/g.38813 Transcript_11813/m.38813 type:complete len:119 (+) Transcript_11813:984-1340(+)
MLALLLLCAGALFGLYLLETCIAAVFFGAKLRLVHSESSLVAEVAHECVPGRFFPSLHLLSAHSQTLAVQLHYLFSRPRRRPRFVERIRAEPDASGERARIAVRTHDHDDVSLTALNS